MSEHEHTWIIASIHAILQTTEQGERQPMNMSAVLHCSSCEAVLPQLSMTQLEDEIRADHVRGDSLAQWASIGGLFQ